MTNGLDVRVVHLERAVMRTSTRVHGEEKGVVINPFLLAVDVHETSDRHAVRRSEKIRCLEVEVFDIEMKSRGKHYHKANTLHVQDG